MYYSIVEKNIECVKYFLSRGGDPNYNKSDAIYFCIENNCYDILYLIKDKIILGHAIIYTSVEKKRLEIFKLLLTKSNVEAFDILDICIQFCKYNKSCEIFRQMLNIAIKHYAGRIDTALM